MKTINYNVDLEKGTTYLSKAYNGNNETRYLEGKLFVSDNGRYKIDEMHGLYSGCELELNLCGTWVKTCIEVTTANKYTAVGLKGLSLAGLTARIRI